MTHVSEPSVATGSTGKVLHPLGIAAYFASIMVAFGLAITKGFNGKVESIGMSYNRDPECVT